MKRSTACLLGSTLVLLLVFNSADFFFHTPYYEAWDSAANALSVNRAKHFAQLYGPYSRWGFYHPGPALFYLQALGEWLFFDWLHLSPAPYNAQTLLYLFFSVGFFVAALRAFTRWLPEGRSRWWFLCAALGFALLHFTAVCAVRSYDVLTGSNVIFSLWSAHTLVLPFLCLLVAGASVAAGGGSDLPLLALADGFLLQTHVAQPLFVFPLTALALAGLWWRCGWQERERISLATTWRTRAAARLGAGWRVFPREHLLAATILGFFALPLLIDLTRGSHSNLAVILHHLRVHQGERKTWGRSFYYLLQYGGYAAYQPASIEFKEYTREGMKAYLGAHWYVFGWVTCLLANLWALSGAVRKPEIITGDPLSESWARRGIRPERQRFLAWAAVFLLAALLLTLKWGTVQDGEMFYYNAWFNFAIYYFGALVALAVAGGWVFALCRAAAAAPAAGGERWAGAAVVVLAGAALAGPLRVRDPSPESTLAFHESVQRALAATTPPGGGPAALRILHFPVGVWLTVAGVALEMERAHQPFYVPDEHLVTFGPEHDWKTAPPAVIRQRGFQPWHFEYLPGVPRAKQKEHAEYAGFLPIVTPAIVLQVTGWQDFLYVRRNVPGIDQNAPGGAQIDFRLGQATPEVCVSGWGDPEPFGSWTTSHHALLGFHATPLTDGSESVDIILAGVRPHLNPAHGLRAQRLRVFFDGQPLEGERRLEGFAESLTYRVPAARWNRAASAPVGGNVMLELEVPDAVSAVTLDPAGPNRDVRLLGLGVREVLFRPVPTAAPRESFGG